MQYKKIKTDTFTMPIHNNWSGEETVILNGQIVSKKSSVMGTHHDFKILESSHLECNLRFAPYRQYRGQQ